MNNQPDNAIDKVLAALRDAAPPEGMNARIAARLEQHAQPQPAPSRWRNLLIGSSPVAAWGRGALSGAAFALLAVAIVVALHHTSAPIPQQAAAAPTRNPAITPASTSTRSATPCAHPAAFRVATAPIPHAAETSWTENIAENTAPSRPAPPMPLTAQERQLVRLVRASNPNELAAISHESQAKQPADDARFFATPPPPPTSEVPAEPNPEPAAESTPGVTPETDQPSPEATSGAASPANQ
jgi:hypothetical protein